MMDSDRVYGRRNSTRISRSIFLVMDLKQQVSTLVGKKLPTPSGVSQYLVFRANSRVLEAFFFFFFSFFRWIGEPPLYSPFGILFLRELFGWLESVFENFWLVGSRGFGRQRHGRLYVRPLEEGIQTKKNSLIIIPISKELYGASYVFVRLAVENATYFYRRKPLTHDCIR